MTLGMMCISVPEVVAVPCNYVVQDTLALEKADEDRKIKAMIESSALNGKHSLKAALEGVWQGRRNGGKDLGNVWEGEPLEDGELANVVDDLLPNKTVRDTINRILELDSSSSGSAGSVIQVQDPRCDQPKAVSPSLSVTPKGRGMPPSLKKDTPKMKQTNLKFHSLERGGIGIEADMAEQKMPTGEAVKEKKKKTTPLPVNAAELHWRASQDCATGYYMMPPAHSPYDPYWGGMQIGMDGYMAPYAIAMPYTQNPFGGQRFPMHVVPPQRNPPRNAGFKRKRCLAVLAAAGLAVLAVAAGFLSTILLLGWLQIHCLHLLSQPLSLLDGLFSFHGCGNVQPTTKLSSVSFPSSITLNKSENSRRGEEYPGHLMSCVRFGYNNMAREEVMVAKAYVDEHGDEVSHDEVITHMMKWRDTRDASLVARGLPTAYLEEIEEKQVMQQCWEFEQARLARETSQCSTQPRLVVQALMSSEL
ncbi:hypothetical protein IFM89_031193 [Coptis chinensis]|uniref:Uncharacterized protein n=1 Tax=Coptis chinensis TaxID=261450 RepID=A0A835M7R0_9MAGN|nr:hypothetical protein IFM89_031193 [Coptis chinensis]